ncbi:GumC family protein [Fibrella forsythiae]|uniref:Lipopolysaccharide biosynthesis protein n=1 Tax=Fibrella forsythiae TaxID=2817061 RepID=A0ABS3JLP4_9BACT|nr:lipopolysaccharide biosynthesis protein [Fibrella forsythiae]MBO0950114.1 lipopolysaccharide biosynthesis protein [Fibrella forsythiae]
MKLDVFLRLLKQHAIWFVLIPLVTAATAFYLTRNEVKTYKSEATLYTGLASGYTLLTDKLASSMDRSTSAFDNLLSTLGSKETMLQVSVGLLADHLQLEQPDSLVLGAEGFQKLQQEIPENVRAELPILASNADLRMALDSLAKLPTANPIKSLLLNSDTYYSISHITEKLKASPRKNTNDVLMMEYEANDPAVAQRTLTYAIEALNKRNTYFKTSETKSVVGFYEEKLKQAKDRLDAADAALRAFGTNHRVLDYDEEARNVAASREALISEYNQEKMRRNGAKAALDALNKRTGQQSGVQLASADLNAKQRKLSEAENQLANARAYNQPKSAIVRLQAAVNQASEDLKASAQKYDAISDNSDALPQQTIAADRLAKSLEYEESSAKLEVYEKRIQEYEAKTNEYSPLGSQIRQLNRNLALAEKEYTDLLDQVDQSRTREKDVSVGGKLDILDAPNFPLAPLASKRKQLVIVSIGVGIFIALLLTALRFWLDKRIKSPEQAEELIGRPVTAMFPTVKNPMAYSKVTRASRSMFEQLLNSINIEIAQVTNKPFPPIITLFSVRPEQGKTWVSNGLIRLYAEADLRIACCYPRKTGTERREDKLGVTYLPYTARPDFMNVTSLEYLLDHDADFDVTQYDRILLELPPLINHQIPVYMMKQSALSLLVIDANAAWGRTEKQLLGLFERVTQQPILTVLNRVGGDYLENTSRAEVGDSAPAPKRALHPQRSDR